MNPDTIDVHEIAIPIARFLKLARLLMAEDPLDAELRSVDIPKVREMMARGNGVVKLVWPGAGAKNVTYIVMENGTPYTTSKLPKGFSKKDITEVHISRPEPTLFPELKAACEDLKRVSASSYETFGCENVVKSVATYYEAATELDQTRNETLVYSLISEVPIESRDPGGSPDAASEWATECGNRLLREYTHLTIAGEAIARAFCTLIYFSISPFPDRLFQLGTTFIREAVGLELASQKYTALPMLEVEFYLLHPDIAGPETFVPARRGARFLQRLGDEIQREARLQSGLNKFHNGLYHALLYYRSAKVMYDIVLSKRVREALPPDWYEELIPDPEALKHDHDACEERRVAILASLTHVRGSHPGVPNFTDGLQFLGWLEWLSRQDFAQAELHIHDLDLRLIYPKFLRDLALGAIQVKQPALVDKGIANLKRVADLLEENLSANMTLEEVNYLSPTYQLLADTFTKAGNISEAQRYSAKASPEYIQQRGLELLKRVGG